MNHPIALLFLFLLVLGCSSDDEPAPIVENLETTIQYKSVSGVDANHHSLDVYYTSDVSTLRPVVIWVHGGGWSIGDKANAMDNKISLLRDQEDYILVSVNYRLSPFPFEVDNPDRIQFLKPLYV